MVGRLRVHDMFLRHGGGDRAAAEAGVAGNVGRVVRLSRGHGAHGCVADLSEVCLITLADIRDVRKGKTAGGCRGGGRDHGRGDVSVGGRSAGWNAAHQLGVGTEV